MYEVLWLVAKMTFYRPGGCCWTSYFNLRFVCPLKVEFERLKKEGKHICWKNEISSSSSSTKGKK